MIPFIIFLFFVYITKHALIRKHRGVPIDSSAPNWKQNYVIKNFKDNYDVNDATSVSTNWSEWCERTVNF